MPATPFRALAAFDYRLLCTAAALACALAGMHTAAYAQQRIRPGETIARPVVQPLPSSDSLPLNTALSKLGRNPRDLDALIDAGNAALAMGDVDAASGFFKRANQVNTNDPRVKAGLGGALARSGDPLSAIALFDAAERSGAQASLIAGDRGLAYDLVGDNATAQRLYRLALARAPSEEVTRRLALSLAISDDRKGAEATLMPLLRDQDKAAWRTRTFALAILAQTDEAIRTAKTILPADLAENMTPYLRYMPQLTRAQQAAAANLGNFPRAAEIGRDDPRFAQYAIAAARPPVAAATGAGLVPRGEPLGRSSRSRNERQAAVAANRSAARRDSEDRRPSRSAVVAARDAARIAPPVPQPSREAVAEPGAATARATPPSSSMSAPIAPAATSSTIPQVAALADGRPAASFVPALPSSAQSPASARASAPPSPRATPTPTAAATRAAARPARPGFDLARLPQSQPVVVAVAPTPAPAAAPAATQAPPSPRPASPAPAAAPPVRVSLTDVFSDLGKPSTAAAPVAGAVDITSITLPRPKAAPVKVAPTKPAPPSHPSRIWVQLGIGRDKGALATDWKRLSGKSATLFKGRKAYVSDMGQTNRMLTGPFASSAQANKFIADLRGAGISGYYVWTSPAGQVVDALASR